MKQSEPVKVSICCATYNHAPYLRQCLDGFMMQKTSFRYEILLHDDASTDGTTDIIKEYAAACPNLIIPVIQSENQYSTQTRAIITTVLMPRAKGQYLAICEGDDYWTDPLKLQKQADILDKNPEISLCMHPSIVLYKNGRKKKYVLYNNSRIACLPDIIRRRHLYRPTASFMYRKERMKNYPDFCLKCHAGDIALIYYMATQGKIYFLNEIMSVYRRNTPGSHTERFGKLDYATRRQMMQTELDMIEGIDTLSGYAYHSDFVKRKLRIQSHLAKRKSSGGRIISCKGFYPDLRLIKQIIIRSKVCISPVIRRFVFKKKEQIT